MFNDAEGREQGFGFKSFQALLNARQLSAPIADPSEEASINEYVARFIEGVSAVASSTAAICRSAFLVMRDLCQQPCAERHDRTEVLPAQWQDRIKGAGAFDRMLKA
ncbi:hypothetical protein ACFYE9_31925 [Rhizobium leguminosarum]|uniref:Uncharacterized protein n=2 Tax=Rhizobium leguminosarum TaxID=384 RepID=A0A154IR90_RHILE|nr:hypothetical protein [Rhizobium leguminosarum]KZB02896.1 hypothetical protein A4A59_08530 [Rhizobium leguminosarum]